MRVERYTGQIDWDGFVRTSRNGTIFHTRRFLSYHPEGRFEDHSLLFYEGDELAAVFPASLKEGLLYSHQGSSHGGFVVPTGTRIVRVQALGHALANYLDEHRYSCRVRMSDPFFDKGQQDDLRFAMWSAGFDVDVYNYSIYYDLHDVRPLSWQARTTLNRGLVMEEGGHSKLSRMFFHEMLSKLLMARYSEKLIHSLDEMDRLHELLGDDLKLYLAWDKGEKIVGGTWVFHTTDHTAHMFYTMSERVKGLYIGHCLVELTKQKVQEWWPGVRYLNYGTCSNDTRQLNAGLAEFKESFGGLSSTRLFFHRSAR